MQTAPDVTVHSGSIDVTLVNVTGTIDTEQNRLIHDVSASRNATRRRNERLLRGNCLRPDNATIELRSEFYQAWGQYLEGEVNGTVRVFDDNETVRVYIDQDGLARRVNERLNHVVDLTNASYMEEVEIEDNTIRVTKNASNEYRVFVEPLGENRLDIGTVRRIENAANVTRDPIDVVFVMDESGSMAGSKRDAAVDAARDFAGQLNGSKDRVGLVGFYQYTDDGAQYYRPNGRYLTDDFEAFNSTVDDISSSGGTYIWAGLRDANALLHLKSDQTRERVVVLLSDGENNPQYPSSISRSADDETRHYAQEAAEMGVTVHTIGFGSGPDESLLRDVNETTGGQYYYAADAEELNDAFRDIATRISSTEQIGRFPVSTNVSTGAGQVHAPQIAGDTDGIAINETDGREYLNVNDPTAPSRFSHAFALTDNESVTFNASTYECNEWRGTAQRRTHNGTGYQVTRCVDMTSTEVTIGEDNASTYVDGDDVSHLVDEDYAWWQESFENKTEMHPHVSLNATDHLEMASNHALVVLDLPDGKEANNKLVLLYRMGLSESAARHDDIVNVNVERVRVD